MIGIAVAVIFLSMIGLTIARAWFGLDRALAGILYAGVVGLAWIAMYHHSRQAP